MTYDLQELISSPLWTYRRTSGLLLGGAVIDLTYGAGTALASFHGDDGDNQANMMWNWKGGAGGCKFGMAWYSFGYDATGQTHSCANWWFENNPGEKISAPQGAFHDRFPSMPQATTVLRYNPYTATPPDYFTQSFAAGIGGPSVVTAGSTNTWSANASGGTPGYTYQWSGALTGTGASVSGALYSNDVLYLDVWDAMGRHIAVSYAVTVNSCPNNQISC